MKFCPECGAPVSESNKFCPNCGSKLTGSEATSIHAIPAAPEAASESADIHPSSSAETTPPVKDTSGLPPAWMPPPVQPGTGMTIESRPARSTSTGDDDVADLPPPPSFMPMPVKQTFGGGGLESVSDDFKMSDLGPPPPPKRRLWLWIPLGVIGFVILCCITFVILSETVLEDTFDRWATEIATDSTEESVGP